MQRQRAARAAQKAGRDFLGSKRQVLHDAATLLDEWLYWSYPIVGGLAATAAICVSMSYGVMFAYLFFGTVLLHHCGQQQHAAWLACGGAVCIEAIGVILVAVRPADALELELEAATAWGAPMVVRATAWFGGGCSFGLQPLRADRKRALGVLGLSLIMLRLLITFLRCGERLGPQVLTTVLPRTFMAVYMGYQFSDYFYNTCVRMASGLVGVNQDLVRTQGSWVALRECYSELHAMMRTVPEDVRKQYTGTGVIPNCYSAQGEATPEIRHRQVGGTCIICLSKPNSHLYVPCGHRCVCIDCATRWDKQGSGTCPMCATPYEDFLRVYDASST